MRIDRTHRKWLVFSIAAMLLFTFIYRWSVRTGCNESSGVTGLIFGSIGFAFILFAGAFSLRKRFRSLRLGKAEAWMRGHLWLGSMSLFLIWFHGGFHHGGPLTAVIMYLLYVTIFSGVVGAIIQHLLPRIMKQRMATETVQQRIPFALGDLVARGDEFAAALAPPADGDLLESWRTQQEMRAKARYGRLARQIDHGKSLLAVIEASPISGASAVLKFYQGQVRPFISGENLKSPIADPRRMGSVFDEQRSTAPAALHPFIDSLKDLCSEARQLRLQRRLNFFLHGWLLIHMPVSFALIILSSVHAVMALRYSMQ